MSATAEGWYRDPYGIHEDRWMSDGSPTKLVRDGGAESYDPPPDRPLPDVLEPAEDGAGGEQARGGGEGYDAGRARRAALDAISGGAIVDEPGGDW